jgi:uncharacterized protein YbjT (DUF2867 family)
METMTHRFGSMLRILFLALTLVVAPLLTGGTAWAAEAKPGETVLVAGATGRTGRLVVQDLAAHGYRVRALVRDFKKAQELLGDKVEYAEGDVRDRKSIDAALKGVDAIVSTIGAAMKDPANSPEFVDYGGTKNLAEAAAAAKVRQIVIESSAGATQKDNPLNRMFNNVLVWKFQGEEAVRRSGVPYTIVRPGGLLDKPGGEKVLTFQQGDKASGAVSRADVATVLRMALEIPAARNRTFELFATSADVPNDWAKLFSALQPDAR